MQADLELKHLKASLMHSIVQEHDNHRASARSASLDSNRQKPILVEDIEDMQQMILATPNKVYVITAEDSMIVDKNSRLIIPRGSTFVSKRNQIEVIDIKSEDEASSHITEDDEDFNGLQQDPIYSGEEEEEVPQSQSFDTDQKIDNIEENDD